MKRVFFLNDLKLGKVSSVFIRKTSYKKNIIGLSAFYLTRQGLMREDQINNFTNSKLSN